MKKLTKTLYFLSLFIILSCTSGVNIEITNDSKIDVKKIVRRLRYLIRSYAAI
jgi:hypothetical protein